MQIESSDRGTTIREQADTIINLGDPPDRDAEKEVPHYAR